MVLWDLFVSFFQVGLFSMGGGYSALPLIEEQAVHLRSWLSLGELADLITIAEMTPGPISLNAATFVGTQQAGFLGAIVATFGNILPSFIIVLTLAVLYKKYGQLTVIQEVLTTIRPAVVSLIASAGVSILIMSLTDVTELAPAIGIFNIFSIILFVGSFIVLRWLKLNQILVMLGSGGVGLVLHWVYSLIGGAAQ